MDSSEHHYSQHAQGQLEIQQHEPRRLSGIYQYHNAPEVIPAHGLEYDDNIYPVSDKYPVTSMDDYPSSYNTKYRENKPPRIIFGMKVRSFLLVTLLFALILVGAVVGGTVGGRNTATTTSNPTTSPTPTSIPSGVETIPAASSTTSTSTVLSTPTSPPLSDCPSINSTTYTSNYAGSTPGSGLNFSRYCDVASPLSSTDTFATAFVYTFEDCIQVCAGYNFFAKVTNCTVAVYDPGATRPANCLVGRANDTGYSDLSFRKDGAVALLQV